MNFSDPRFWLDLFLVCLTALNTAVVWLRKPGEQAQAAVEALSDRLDKELGEIKSDAVKAQAQLSGRLQAVEGRMDHIPTDDELATLRGDVQEVKAVVEGQRELLRRVERQQTLILEQLLTQPK